MKRQLLLFTFAVCLTLPFLSHAQRGRRGSANLAMGPTFGLKAGASFSSLSGTDTKLLPAGANTITYDTKLGVVAGALFNYRFTQQVSMQIEALYAGRGFVAKVGRQDGSNIEQSVSMNFADVPALLKLNAKVFYLEAGAVGSFLTTAQSKTKVTNAAGTSEKEEEIEGIKSLDVGGAIGAGIEASQGFIFGVRYVRGFSSIGANTGPYAGRSLENYTLQVTAGYIFNHSSGRGRRR